MGSREIKISLPARQGSSERSYFLLSQQQEQDPEYIPIRRRRNATVIPPREIIINDRRVEAFHQRESSQNSTSTRNVTLERRNSRDSSAPAKDHTDEKNTTEGRSSVEWVSEAELEGSNDGEDVCSRVGTLVPNGSVSTTNKAYAKKYKQFRRKLHRRMYWRFHSKPGNVILKLLCVKRDNILEDSFCAIQASEKIQDLKHRLFVNFINEESTDIGGVQREWFMKLSKEMFNPEYGFFTYCSDENYLLEINPHSAQLCENYLDVFRFIGNITGLAVYHGLIIDGVFIAPFYRMMLNKNISLQDVELADPTLYRSLLYLIKNDAAECDLTFSVVDKYMGITKEIDLVPNGRNIPITDANKHWFVREMIEWRFVSRIREQMSEFMSGFHTFIKPKRIQSFHEDELSILLAGQPTVSVTDWKTYTRYAMGYNPRHPVIVNFWRVVCQLSEEKKGRLLEFVTGAPRVPINGFAELRGGTEVHQFMVIQKGSIDSLPVAHTCINALELPPYPDIATLRSKLLTAISNTEGFSGVDDPAFSNILTLLSMQTQGEEF